ncbi:PAS domain S-box-containing protein/diguanylate cyclase (GGDEF) domain-containing protein [Halopseudomonas xinjiangensis]|uniref:PAS domain S-box-containing protein/diguanylate cyclase (GGDEF) domain-containing protein n=1 Tax=Halopseudomonas xinjiangensis TaxID=487184 RepID=A0A1H1TVN9_9GAMM|nr:sensor domain-containing diguanylate cyclase [Halopseudomonas xinjiangensis]SDS64252.1 PAS domain S-box-containing protein/diguanylate cyclase (GGDEF) domain-containing protein [Halopseudomonas xinjiangensis]
MKSFARLFRTRLALRSAALTLVAVGLLGAVSLIGAMLISERRERNEQHHRLEELLDTVERTVQIACFLDNRDLAAEVASGLLSNGIVGRVQIVQAGSVLLEMGDSDRRRAVALERSVVSPFVDDEEVCRIVLTPNVEQIRRSVFEASLFIAILLTLQLIGIGAAVVWVIVRLVTRPIRDVSRRLRHLDGESGEKLSIPPGNERDELGRLVMSVNAMIDRLVSSLRGERELRVQREIEERRFRTIFDNVETGIFEVDGSGRVFSANPAFKRMFGLDAATDLSAGTLRLCDLCELPMDDIDAVLVACEGDRPAQQLEVRLGSAAHPRWIAMLFNVYGRDRYQGVANDVTDRHLATQAAEQMALTDALTGLGNRRGLSRRLEQAARELELDPAQRPVLIMLDLDRFKQANDTFGHAMGDRILQHVARLWAELVREDDFVARLGGDEFVVLLNGPVRRESLERILSRFLELVNLPIPLDADRSAQVGASLGIATLGEDAHTPETLLSHADEAMYQAKRAGRNCYRFYADGEG